MPPCHAYEDPYENIYTVLRGSKHFLLLPPTEGFLLTELPFPRAVYRRREEDGKLILQPLVRQSQSRASDAGSEGAEDRKCADEEGDSNGSMTGSVNEVSWASVDPKLLATLPHSMLSESSKDFVKYARPIHVELHEGETLYLPSGRSFDNTTCLPC